MPPEVVVALIAGIAAAIGGAIGAIASPIGQDWVARREFERKQQQQEQARTRSAQERRQADRDASAQRTLDALGEAMHHFDLEWRGKAAYRAEAAARKAAEEAWVSSRNLEDATCRALVDEWKQQFDEGDMRYRSGAAPSGLSNLMSAYTNAAERLGDLVRDADEGKDSSTTTATTA